MPQENTNQNKNNVIILIVFLVITILFKFIYILSLPEYECGPCLDGGDPCSTPCSRLTFATSETLNFCLFYLIPCIIIFYFIRYFYKKYKSNGSK